MSSQYLISIPGRWSVRIAGVVLVLAAILWPSPAAHAAGPLAGIPLPFPAESVWQVVNGYNTDSHAGVDPHALDLMRLDAPAAGTEVLAPVPGQVSYVGESCLSIYDQSQVSHLLCHVIAVDGLARGDWVFAGEVVATIAPAGQAENLNFPHLHYALHTRVEALRLTDTIPFTGRYALEGENLPDTGIYHQHGDLVLRSTNQRRAAEPGREYLSPGWNLVGWLQDGLVTLPASAKPAVRSLFSFSAQTQSFRGYAPSLPASVSRAPSLRFGDGVWLYVDAAAGAEWEQPLVVRDRVVALEAGMNLVTWTPESRRLEAAVAGLDDLIAVHAFDAKTQQFHSYRVNGPNGIDAVRELKSGEAIWVEMEAAAEWQQQRPQRVGPSSPELRRFYRPEPVGRGE